MLWKEERSRVRAVQMDRMDRVLNAWIRELCRAMKGLGEKLDEGNLQRIERDRIAKRIYIGECAGSCSVGRKHKRWIDTVKECFKKKRFGYKASKDNCLG